MTDWDKLEGDELNLPLARFAGWHGEEVWFTDEDGDTAYLFPPGVEESDDRSQDSFVPPYHRSVDASIRDLVPLLGDDFYWLMLFPGEAAMGWRPRPHDETKPWETETIGGKDTVLATAVARVMGKALEGRSD